MNKRSIFIGVLFFSTFMISCKPNKSGEKSSTQEDNILTEQETSAGWKLLFDGKTLEGWRMYQNKAADAWGVKNGELYCKGSETDKSDLRADIITTDQFENYELSIDWKLSLIHIFGTTATSNFVLPVNPCGWRTISVRYFDGTRYWRCV